MDKVNQDSIARWMAEKWKSQFHGLPSFYGLDYAIERNNQIAGFAEIRYVKNHSPQQTTHTVALHKLLKAHEVFNATGIDTFLIVQWGDCIGYTKLSSPDTKEWTITLGGSTDKNDPADIEPVCHIPMDQFKMLSQA